MSKTRPTLFLHSLQPKEEKLIKSTLKAHFNIKKFSPTNNEVNCDVIISGDGHFVDEAFERETYGTKAIFQIIYGSYLAQKAAGYFSIPLIPQVLLVTIKNFDHSGNKESTYSTQKSFIVENSYPAIENERENLRSLFRQTPEMVCIMKGPNHKFEFVNDAHIKALGFDATGLSAREAQPESIELHHILDTVYSTGKTAELFETPITVGNQLRYFNLTFSARKNSLSIVDGLMVLGAEITEQFLAREMFRTQCIALQMTMNGEPLKEVLNVLALAVEENLPRGVFCTILLLNSDGVSLRLGAAPSLPDSFHKAVDGLEIGPNSVGCGRAAYLKREVTVNDIRTNPSWSMYSDLVEENNIKSCWSTPLMTSHEELIGTFCLYNRAPEDPSTQERQILELIKQTISLIIERDLDIQKRTKAEHALRESKKLQYSSEEQLKMAVEVAKVGFYDWDIKNDVVKISTQISKDWGINSDTTTLDHIYNSIHKDDIERITELVKATIKDDAVYHTTYRIIKSNGETEWMEVRGKVQRNRKGEPVRFFGTSIVVTEQKKREASLKQAQITAENASTAKGIFLANMSHEIRTPLGAIMGFLNILKDPDISQDELNEYIGIIDRSSKQLLHIVNDVLDLSKIEAGKFTTDPTEFSLVELLNDFNSLMSFKSKEKGLVYEMKLETKIPDWVKADHTRFRQILSNLVGNAIKFTSNGFVYLKLSFSEDEILTVEVQDSGCGISKNAQMKVFEPFSQEDNSTTRIYGGTGLGLNLTRRLSEAMGGEFYLKESEVGVGTTFCISLPFELLPKTQMLDQSQVSIVSEEEPQTGFELLPAAHVLIVEDTLENQQLLKIFLDRWGITSEVADNGSEGVERALAGHFDLVLMDIQMPVMDGYEATTLLRDKGYDIPVVALTAHAMKEEKDKCYESGFTDFLTKPIDQDSLYKVLMSNQHTGKSLH
jgi:PAS domain S-box-containing protein